ncbi:2OG-Fe(II) oxygenase [Variovorax arabinosiphilus]|uniref:2OG-Fe(II) oxygenase n=1 Tax=Variovorax arabinosiphilus TaxID=3053498 RepID=UPI002577DA05|nr:MULTISPECIES: 2OG-Fe(II) oxygenase [unclassified Variovorax]MDM0122213.1 2OG-Fe(II) oxygenase [Variovorax sp. J2L1-78]MDM0131258.1 2OG-Fe(II) oxygenase [Variovorax sp. J2L1-63]MDM0234976.1 2OG-Fe(II) oxygenase [Variovorax sp. J2R1-6]
MGVTSQELSGAVTAPEKRICDVGGAFACANVSVRIYDDLVPHGLFSRLVGLLAWVPMYCLKRTERDAAAHPLDLYWYYPVLTVNDRYIDDAEPSLEELPENMFPVRELWGVVRGLVGSAVRLYEIEYTANAFGTEGHPHYDSPRETLRSTHVTAIVYCNEEWRPEWAGETAVFDDRQDIHRAVIPKPGRICLIFGDPLHAARGIARICPHPRRVLVFKMWLSPQQQ